MSTERRSAFSRAARLVNPAPDATVSHYSLQLALAELGRARGMVAELRGALELATGMIDSQCDALAQMRVSLSASSSANPGTGETPAATPAKPLRELRAMVDELATHYANDCKCKLSNGFVCIVHRARALLAKLEAEGK